MNKYYSTNLDSYEESEALQQLLIAADDAITQVAEQLEINDDFFSEFTITINGIQTAFITGAPQIEALYAFIQHIAAENLYAVDMNEMKVIG